MTPDQLPDPPPRDETHLSDPFAITTSEEVTAILGEVPDVVKDKVRDHIDDPSQRFLARSPLAVVATVDADGRLDVSPKGDAAGFVQTLDPTTLLVPERKGNNLAFGPRNIVATGRIGLIFVVPGQRETLRVNGSASLTTDPVLLDLLAAQGKPSLLCTRVEVEECFFHCGKAFIRSQLWQPDTWRTDGGSALVDQVVEVLGGDAALAPAISAALEQNYVDDLY